MFSKSWIRAFTFSLSLVLAACSGEGKDAREPVVVTLKGNNDCLTKLGTRLGDLINDRLNKAQIEDLWTCTANAIGDFEKITAGDITVDRYSPQIIREFLQRYFFKDLHIDDALLVQLMQIKRVLLSGTEREVTREELVKIQALLGELKAFSVELQPHIGVLFRAKRNVTDAQTIAATQALEKALPRISRWLMAQNQPYKISDLREIIVRLKNWVGEEKDQSDVDKLVNLFVPVKQILLGNSQPQINGGEWQDVILALRDFYSLYLGVASGMDKNLDALFISRALPLGVDSLVKALERATGAHAGQHIPNSEVYNLFAAIQKAELLPKDFSQEGLTQAWDWLLKRLLQQSVVEDGFGTAQVAVFRSRVDQWLGLLDDIEMNRVLSTDFSQMVNDSVPLVWDQEGRQVIGPKAPKTWDVYGLRHMAWSYVLIDWVKTAYVGSEPKALTIPEFEAAVTEVLPVLQGFGWLKDSKTDIYVRLQREADLFTMSSNGNHLLEVSEAVRYLNFVVSAYRSADIWLTEVKAAGCESLDPKCVRPFALQPGGSVLDSIPLMKANMTKLPPKTFISYMKYAEEILFDKAKTEPISVGDLLQVWALFQYVDTFIQRYDVNDTDTIAAGEGRTAFVVYGPILTDLLQSANIPPDAMLPFFTFMLKFGDTPFSMLNGPVAFQYWRHHESAWLFESERLQLMSILRQLAQLKN